MPDFPSLNLLFNSGVCQFKIEASARKMNQFYLLKDSSGKKSVSYTMMLITFLVCTLWLLLSIFESIAGLHVREFSAETATFWFSPLCILYFGRKKWPGVTAKDLESKNQTQENE